MLWLSAISNSKLLNPELLLLQLHPRFLTEQARNQRFTFLPYSLKPKVISPINQIFTCLLFPSRSLSECTLEKAKRKITKLQVIASNPPPYIWCLWVQVSTLCSLKRQELIPEDTGNPTYSQTHWKLLEGNSLQHLEFCLSLSVLQGDKDTVRPPISTPIKLEGDLGHARSSHLLFWYHLLLKTFIITFIITFNFHQNIF